MEASKEFPKLYRRRCAISAMIHSVHNRGRFLGARSCHKARSVLRRFILARHAGLVRERRTDVRFFIFFLFGFLSFRAALHVPMHLPPIRLDLIPSSDDTWPLAGWIRVHGEGVVFHRTAPTAPTARERPSLHSIGIRAHAPRLRCSRAGTGLDTLHDPWPSARHILPKCRGITRRQSHPICGLFCSSYPLWETLPAPRQVAANDPILPFALSLPPSLSINTGWLAGPSVTKPLEHCSGLFTALHILSSPNSSVFSQSQPKAPNRAPSKNDVALHTEIKKPRRVSFRVLSPSASPR